MSLLLKCLFLLQVLQWMRIFTLTEQHGNLFRWSGEPNSILISLAVHWHSGIFLITDHKLVILLQERIWDTGWHFPTLIKFFCNNQQGEITHLMKCLFGKGYYRTKLACRKYCSINSPLRFWQPTRHTSWCHCSVAKHVKIIYCRYPPSSICFKLESCLTKAKYHLANTLPCL